MPMRLTPGSGRANALKEDDRNNHPGGDLQSLGCRTGDHMGCKACDCTCHPREARDWARQRS
jgi:hypothetical protein